MRREILIQLTVVGVMVAVSLEVGSAAASNEIKADNVQEYLKLMNTKLDIINSAILNGNLCSDLKSTFDEKFELIEQRLEELYHKSDELINQNNKTTKFDRKKHQNHHLNIDEDLSMPDDNDFRNRFLMKSENQTGTNNNEKLRRSRDNDINVNFINEILRMVNDRLGREKNLFVASSSSATSSMTDILSNSNAAAEENLNSESLSSSSQLSISQKRKNMNTTTINGNGRKSNIVFPNIKNRLAMMNASSNFISSIKRETHVMMKKFNLSWWITLTQGSFICSHT